MSTIEKIAKGSDSKSFKKLNPHLFKPGDTLTVIECHHRFTGDGSLKQKKRIRQSEKPLLNKLEAEFLDRLKTDAKRFELPEPRPQAIKLKLANGVFYKPDLFSTWWPVTHTGKPTAWEIKCLRGKSVDRGKLALKVAASLWPEIRFILAWKENNQWHEQEILP